MSAGGYIRAKVHKKWFCCHYLPQNHLVGATFAATLPLQVVLLQTVFGQLLIFCAGAAVVGIGVNADAATRGEQACHFNVFGVHQFDEILHDDVHAVLMEVAMIAETEQVKLEAFAFNHEFVGQV